MRRRSGFWSRRGSVGTLLVGLVVVAVAAPSWATPGAVLWTARFDGPTMSDDSAAAFALSPDGAKLYVTGKSPFNAFNGYDYATRAYDTGTGATLWTKYYNDASVDADDMATAITVSPDGSKVFVTGSSAQPGCRGITTVAMNATTGGALWTQRYCQPQGYVTDSSPSIAVSGDGTKVFVAGRSSLNGIGTITYNATTGALLWTKSTTANATAVKVAVSPDSTKVFVTGYRVANNYSWQTIAYSTSNGAQLWSKSYFGSSSARPSALAVSPDGSKVFVTGFSLPDPSTGTDFETIAYSATTGAIVWAKRLAGSGNGTAYDQAKAIHVSPDGTKVFVTGITLRPVTGDDYLTAAVPGIRRDVPVGRALRRSRPPWGGTERDHGQPGQHQGVRHRSQQRQHDLHTSHLLQRLHDRCLRRRHGRGRRGQPVSTDQSTAMTPPSRSP